MRDLLTLIRTNRFAQIALGATFGILVLIIVLTPHSPSSDSPTRFTPNEASDEVARPELAKLDTTTKQSAILYRTNITDALPITVREFSTSVGINTTIYLYILPEDPPSTVRFEIFGISYLNPDIEDNLNATAFAESYQHALSLLRAKDLKPENMIFIYSDIDYIRERATDWVQTLNLR